MLCNSVPENAPATAMMLSPKHPRDAFVDLTNANGHSLLLQNPLCCGNVHSLRSSLAATLGAILKQARASKERSCLTIDACLKSSNKAFVSRSALTRATRLMSLVQACIAASETSWCRALAFGTKASASMCSSLATNDATRIHQRIRERQTGRKQQKERTDGEAVNFHIQQITAVTQTLPFKRNRPARCG